MNKTKREKLEAAGWKVGSTAGLLKLSAEEKSIIEIKIALARRLKALRQKRRMTQGQLASRIESSQSRVAKMEIADRSVSIDRLVRSLLALGASRRNIGAIIGARLAKQTKKSRPRAAKKKRAAAR